MYFHQSTSVKKILVVQCLLCIVFDLHVTVNCKLCVLMFFHQHDTLMSSRMLLSVMNITIRQSILALVFVWRILGWLVGWLIVVGGGGGGNGGGGIF